MECWCHLLCVFSSEIRYESQPFTPFEMRKTPFVRAVLSYGGMSVDCHYEYI